MKFVTSFPLSGNGSDFREFGYTGSSDDLSGCWIAVPICVTGARHIIIITIIIIIIIIIFISDSNLIQYASNFNIKSLDKFSVSIAVIF
jgi:hypothetical protein